MLPAAAATYAETMKIPFDQSQKVKSLQHIKPYQMQK